MRATRFAAIRGFVMVVTAAVALPAAAQVVAPGPYYAKPSWDQTLPCETPAGCTRFVVLSNMNSEAVLDRETGLVWERSPSERKSSGAQAASDCTLKTVGNRQGWRLPTAQELKSLVDPSASMPTLPPGHPFTNLFYSTASGSVDFYWTASVSATTIVPDDNLLLFSLGSTLISASAPRTVPNFARAWCVRGGQGTLLQ